MHFPIPPSPSSCCVLKLVEHSNSTVTVRVVSPAWWSTAAAIACWAACVSKMQHTNDPSAALWIEPFYPPYLQATSFFAWKKKASAVFGKADCKGFFLPLHLPAPQFWWSHQSKDCITDAQAYLVLYWEMGQLLPFIDKRDAMLPNRALCSS